MAHLIRQVAQGAFANGEPPQQHRPVLFWSQPEECDLCQQPLISEPGFCDAVLPGFDGRWGFACLSCMTRYRIRIGWGVGQFFAKSSSSGVWYLVDGQDTSLAPTLNA